MAEWLGRGLQNPVRRFNSALRLQRAGGGMVDALRSGRSGSNPVEVQVLSRPPQ